jgi:PTH2 family peptidyl-tRNA hydrolase
MSEPKMVIAVRRDLNLRKGKLAGQVGHAVMKFLIDNNESERADELFVKLSKPEAIWMFNGVFAKVIVGVDSEQELLDLILRAQLKNVEVSPIVDLGRTEFNGVKTLTCAAFGPDDPDVLDEVTGHLKLL